MKKTGLFFIFLFINFGALGIGRLLMENGPTTEWYMDLNKAPWTPPGWVFGTAWTSIMLCFSVYMTFLYGTLTSNRIWGLFTVQFLLNISWNYIFFNQHLITLGFINLILLSLLVFCFLIAFYNTLKLKSLFVVPYAVWLCVATSLNLYILLYN
ncbi:TspO/MBR family protein [Flavivirga rizhaonensis]|uniref:Tryptophan-rich sensory protein n=1 Tax=Flavivirga rizhaonensis TaxID=2559571 RepID=A0A4S1DRJ3_9FLAO|nr:TspO/MBR family protein [Flavivirga rizhaonensis]TGV00570.1 tryptophan-rich sensory protein [Flavivirga rizhaonensis]